MSLLKVHKLTVETKDQQIVKEISFEVDPGDWLAIVGQSGSGKSMTASAIGQLLKPNLQAKGTIEFNGANVLAMTSKKMRSIRGNRISYIFQDYQSSFTPFLTIGKHFDEYQRTHLRMTKAQRNKNTQEALGSVGLTKDLVSRYPFQLSGGQLQRTAIALALLLKPDLVIADEPTTALDSISSFRILQLLAKLQEETGCAILFITHDLRHASKYADRILVMKEGHIIEQGDQSTILEFPKHPYTQALVEAIPVLKKPENLHDRRSDENVDED
ncbi:ABC transporter ATP-binding protein [Planococcus sp. 4-30]|uniref:ABC transporter ATP-binding protein n=1 Tax=Planococcus sp. 4-30 TaxID=2874583 RepID=UPI001CC11DCD|nr:ABC transporter ATP-binding protein [Planococcus sp. 4-30]